LAVQEPQDTSEAESKQISLTFSFGKSKAYLLVLATGLEPVQEITPTGF